MAKFLTQEEKEAHIMMANLIKKPINFKTTDFKPGNMLLFHYKAKYDKNPYDATPLCFVLKRSASYILGLNFHWLPKPLRKLFVDAIFKNNKTNIKKNKPLEINYKIIKGLLMKFGAPALRLYIRHRISPKGVVVPHTDYFRAVDLRAEHFINISADQAWNLARKKFKEKGMKKVQKK